MVISAAAPLTGVAGAMPLAFLLGNGTGIPLTFILLTLVMLAFAAGYVAMSRHVTNAGAFYAYAARGLGGHAGGAVAIVAVVAYNTMQFGLIGLFGGIASGCSASSASCLAWWVWSLIAVALVGILGYRQVDLSAKVLIVLVALEYLIVFVVDARHPVFRRGRGAVGQHLRLCGLQLRLADRRDPVLPGLLHRDRGDDDLRRRGPRPRKDHSARHLSGGADDRRVLRLHHLADDLARDRPPVPMCRAGRSDACSSFWPKCTPIRPSHDCGVLLVSSLFAALSAFHNYIARYHYVAGREGCCQRYSAHP